MARIIKEQEYAKKRNEILDATQRLIYVKGFEKMTIQDIQNELKISSGAFYHYFDSKPAVLEGIIERIREVSEEVILPVIHDPHKSALEKLQGFFDVLDNLRIESKTEIVELGRVWYNDSNAIVRQKVDEAVTEQRVPLLTEIVAQGIQEGVFTSDYPDRAGEVILSLLHGMGNAHARILLSIGPQSDERHCIEDIITIHAAYMDAVERILGLPTESLYRADVEKAQVWVSAARGNGKGQKSDVK